jgi:hypothetical protein
VPSDHNGLSARSDVPSDANTHPDADADADTDADTDTDADADTVSARRGVPARFWRSGQSRADLFGRTNAYCSEQLLLQQRPSLYERAGSAGVLQRPSRQRPVPVFDAAS